MSKRIFANLGFLLQIAGLLTILPIGIGLYFSENETLVPLLVTCVAFLGGGFLFNSLCERKDLDFKSANVLFVVAFLLLPLIGAIPYFFSDPFPSPNVVERFTNGIFESVSGFTTTGFSFISAPEALPTSMLVYRSLTELMGGVGIVFLLLAFFQSKRSLENLGISIGVDNVNGNLKRTFGSVFAIYGVFIVAFTILFYLIGFQNPISTGTFVIDTITGGYQPSIQAFQQYLSFTPEIFLIILMLIGSLNFAFSYNLLTLKPRKAFTSEVLVYFAIILVGTASVAVLVNVNGLDSLFHVVSMSSSTGQSYLPMSAFGSTGLSILIVIMLIGGCTFSMAGGIRVSRIIAFGKTVKENLLNVFKAESDDTKVTKNGNEHNAQNLSAALSILLFIVTLVIFSVIFTTLPSVPEGVPPLTFTNAIFEVGSALTTNGISMGYTTLTMGIGYKWLMIAAMTIGRVEVLTILIALMPFGKKKMSTPSSQKNEEY
jgi:trk system potassium uptake protein TrkH